MRKTAQTIDKLAIVIVTYRRQELLANLFKSIMNLSTPVWKMIVVDNENSDETQSMVNDLREALTQQWGTSVEDTHNSDENTRNVDENTPSSDENARNNQRVVYLPQATNGGGAGGFHAGVKEAYALGAQWIWVMDDDVSVQRHAIETLAPWTRRYQVIQPSRFDYDGGRFYWQYRFITSMGIPNPIAPKAFGASRHHSMNTMCFEGALFHRGVVKKIGYPDPRFFIYWDDSLYGYLASKVTDAVVIEDVALQRTRDIAHWNIAGIRQLNSTSDMNRYYIMRNRGLLARYFMIHGDYRPLLFSLGTAATVCKEFIRLIAVDRKHIVSGVRQLYKGWRDSHAILHDDDFQPMPSLQE